LIPIELLNVGVGGAVSGQNASGMAIPTSKRPRGNVSVEAARYWVKRERNPNKGHKREEQSKVRLLQPRTGAYGTA